MDELLAKVKDLLTNYLFIIIFGTAVFNIFVDCKSLKKKGLLREEKICKSIGFGYLGLVVVLFIAKKYIS